MTNATSSSFFSSILYAFNGRIGDLIASTSATLASTTAYGRFITGTVVATSSTGTSTFSGRWKTLIQKEEQAGTTGAIPQLTAADGTALAQRLYTETL
jgi:proline racemase